MRILAIETSCDETGIAIVEGEKTPSGFLFRTLGSALHSQAALHAQYGGVYPTLAKREHEKNLPILLKEALVGAGLDDGDTVDAVVVTSGPGLEPALWSGITFAERLAKSWQKPLFGVNHMEGHLLSSLVSEEGQLPMPALPLLGLLISGGHTEFVLMEEWLTYRVIGETLDDAVGEAFDKVARMLGLPYPGGPHISKHATRAREQNLLSPLKLPRPMETSGTCDMSFSGLKTAALYALRDMGGADTLSEDTRAAFAREFEDAAADVFVSKTRKALTESGAQTFVIGGGVAANNHIRHMLKKLVEDEFPNVALFLPDPSITGDNAVMIAQAALVEFLSGKWHTHTPPAEIKAVGNLSIAS